MLNYKNTIIAFVVLIIIIGFFDYLMPVNPLLYLGIVIVLMVIMGWNSKRIRSNFYIRSYCSGSKERKAVAITFDDGPDAQVTPMILDVLKENKVQAAFFIIGSKAEMHPEILKRINKEGHIIGGHSYSHDFFFDLFSSGHMKNEMIKTEDVVFSATGKRLSLFRPPYGVTNPPLAKAITQMEYKSIGWSLRSNDTVMQNPSDLFVNVTKKVQNGDVLLFHDNKPWTVNAVDKVIKFLREKGYEIVPLDKLLKIQAYVN